MQWLIVTNWSWFCMALGVAAFATVIMSRLSQDFYTNDGILRQFSIMELEIAGRPKNISDLIKGIYKLPEEQRSKSLRALRGQLLVDFLFMPAIYGAIFFACMKVANKLEKWWGQDIFIALAWGQALCMLCDIIENVYLLQKIKPDVEPSSNSLHTAYQYMEIVKWGVSLTAAVSSIAALLFFWVSGNYSAISLPYLLLVVSEIIVFFILLKITSKKKVERV